MTVLGDRKSFLSYDFRNEYLTRRKVLATCHWQWYISDHRTVTKYQPCQSTCTVLYLHSEARCPEAS